MKQIQLLLSGCLVLACTASHIQPICPMLDEWTSRDVIFQHLWICLPESITTDLADRLQEKL